MTISSGTENRWWGQMNRVTVFEATQHIFLISHTVPERTAHWYGMQLGTCSRKRPENAKFFIWVFKLPKMLSNLCFLKIVLCSKIRFFLNVVWIHNIQYFTLFPILVNEHPGSAPHGGRWPRERPSCWSPVFYPRPLRVCIFLKHCCQRSRSWGTSCTRTGRGWWGAKLQFPSRRWHWTVIPWSQLQLHCLIVTFDPMFVSKDFSHR